MEYQRDAERRVRIGVVGVGSHSYRNILSTLTYLPVELVAIADVDAPTAEKTARQYAAKAYTSATEMYAAEDLEAVLLCVSPQLHPQLAVEAFEAGLHVWLEKPVGVLAEDVEKMISARGDRIAVVGFKKAFMPATRKAIELLAEEGSTPLRTLMGTYPMDVPPNGKDVIANRETPSFIHAGTACPLR